MSNACESQLRSRIMVTAKEALIGFILDKASFANGADAAQLLRGSPTPLKLR